MVTYIDILRGDGTGSLRCPFHDDTHASAKFFPNGTFWCFGCQVSARSHKDFVRKLLFSEQPFSVGMRMAEEYINHKKLIPTREPVAVPEVHVGVTTAMTIFGQLASEQLSRDRPLMSLIRAERGIQNPVALGLGVTSKVLLQPLRAILSNEYSQDTISKLLISAGITTADGIYRLSRRIFIPEIRNEQVIYYQGRTLGQGVKYLNPPLPRALFGLSSLNRDTEYVVLTEGPFDVFPLIELGLSGVAVLGASRDLAKLIDIIGDKQIIVAFDNDDAGQKQAEYVTNGLVSMGYNAITLPPPTPYKDYGEWAAKCGAEEIVRTIELCR